MLQGLRVGTSSVRGKRTSLEPSNCSCFWCLRGASSTAVVIAETSLDMCFVFENTIKSSSSSSPVFSKMRVFFNGIVSCHILSTIHLEPLWEVLILEKNPLNPLSVEGERRGRRNLSFLFGVTAYCSNISRW